MDLSNISDDVLLDRTYRYARSERKITHIVLWHINEVERRGLYAQLKYDSIFKYISKHLGYGEKSAYERMHASRLLGKMPELAEKMEEGTLNLTQIVQVQSCINKETRAGNKVDQAQTARIFEKIESLSGEKTLKTLAIEFNQPIQMHEVIQPQRDDTVRASLTFTDEEMEIMKHVKDLLSHALPNPTWAELMVYLAKKQIKAIEGKQLKTLDKLDRSEAPVKSATQLKVNLPILRMLYRKPSKSYRKRRGLKWRDLEACCQQKQRNASALRGSARQLRSRRAVN